jgi:hypothetical protein
MTGFQPVGGLNARVLTQRRERRKGAKGDADCGFPRAAPLAILTAASVLIAGIMKSTGTGSLTSWIEYVFDHPVEDLIWYEASEFPTPAWEGTHEQIARHIAETFEQSGRLLGRFSDAQLDQDFWFLAGVGNSDFMMSLIDSAVPESLRLRALRSFVPLFEQVMAVRCSPHLSHLDEPGANVLNTLCYMWWDILPIRGSPEDPARRDFDAEVLAVLRRILGIPHDACRESALHGLGHWSTAYPDAAEIIDAFLSTAHGLRPELAAYAERAKAGRIQ